MGKVVLNPASEPIICKHSSVFGLGSMNTGNILQLVVHSYGWLKLKSQERRLPY